MFLHQHIDDSDTKMSLGLTKLPRIDIKQVWGQKTADGNYPPVG